MAKDPEIDTPPVPPDGSAEIGKPDDQPAGNLEEGSVYEGVEEVDKAYWISCLDDAERAEQNWRSRARDIIQIYRNDGNLGKKGKAGDGPITFNILYANTEVMLPAVYMKPPQAVVRSRFTKVTTPMAPPPGLLPPGMAPPPGALPPDIAPGGAPGLPMSPGAPAGMGPSSPVGLGGPGMPPSPVAAPPGPPPMGAPDLAPAPPIGGASPLAINAGMGAPPPGLPVGDVGPIPPAPVVDGGPPPLAPPPGGLAGAPPPAMPGMPQAAPGRPSQEAIETAASIMQKTLEIVVEDEHSDEAVKLAIKDVLLPGRGVCRVRWKPVMEDKPVLAADGATPLPPSTPGAPPLTEEVKVWESVGDEYVYWEDLLVDPVRQARDTEWVAFRHLFTAKALEAEFGGSPQYEQLKSLNRLGDILKWTEESAAKSPVGGGSAMKTAEKLGDHVKKAMVWEIWSRAERKIIWFIREVSGLVLRVDEDSLQLAGFYPIPVPMLAVRTSDSRIPRPYFDLYARLASDLDETSDRISALTKQIKARGAYNAASKEIAQILGAADQKMIGVDGVDMITGGLQNHIWMVPIEVFVIALEKLYLAREQQKQSIYEIMGISDIMRGATKASETATAQRIKGSMGVSRLEDAKQQADNFVRDLLRLKAEIIAQNFSPETLEAMTGELVTPEVLDILRSDFQRTCAIDIESDSTVAPDEQQEQQSMAMVMQSVQAVMQGAVAMLGTGILPPPMVLQLSLEMLKMFLHPVRYSRGVVEMINDFQEQLTAQIGMMAMMPPGAPMMGGPPPPGPMGGMGPAPPPMSKGGGNGAAPPGVGGDQGSPPPPLGAMQ